MAFTVPIKMKMSFTVACPFENVFDSLADVPYSADHFPKVKELVDLGGERYRWEMEKIGLDRYFIQTVYASEYTWDKEEGWIAWTPVPGEGNARVTGRWDLKEIAEGKTKVSFETDAELDLPLPSIAKILLAPMIKRQFEELVNEYLENLKATWKELAKG